MPKRTTQAFVQHGAHRKSNKSATKQKKISDAVADTQQDLIVAPKRQYRKKSFEIVIEKLDQQTNVFQTGNENQALAIKKLSPPFQKSLALHTPSTPIQHTKDPAKIAVIKTSEKSTVINEISEDSEDDSQIPAWVIKNMKKTPKVRFNKDALQTQASNKDNQAKFNNIQPPPIIAFSEIKPSSAFSDEKDVEDYLTWRSQLQTFYDQKPHMHLKTVGELQEKLDECFDPLANPLLRLEALRHERHQSVRIFAARVRTVVFHYLGSTTHPSYDDTCILHFLKKLRPEFKTNIKTRPATWIEAVKIASDTESELQIELANVGVEN